MKALNELIKEYTHDLQQGEIQLAYKGILDFIGQLRAYFVKNDPDYDIGGIYQGYMDMSYFSLSTKSLREKGLKIAVVYLHEKGVFEAWLSARNRDIARGYESVFNSKADFLQAHSFFHDSHNQDAILEYTLTTAPDFENQDLLMKLIERGVEKFAAAVASRL